MATVNQIRKQIETAEKRLAKAEKNVAMYDARIDSAIVRASKVVNCEVTRENYNEVVSPKSNFSTWYAIEMNFDSKAENEKAVVRETREIERLKNMLSGMTIEETPTGCLESVLSAIMADFREAWIEKMMAWYGEHYDWVNERVEGARVRYDRVRGIMERYWVIYRDHRSLYNRLEEIRMGCAQILADDAAGMEKSKYLAKMRRETVLKWSACVKKLALKCAKFDVDGTKVSASKPTVTEKGFECVLTDDKPRLIYARMIWAAEYSEFVSPHTRYIVTERKK